MSTEAPKVLVVIPARHGSSRFPGKALADLGGRPLILRTVANAARMKSAHEIIVATDDRRILEAVADAGFRAEMTGDHPSGTDRIGEVARRHGADIVLNLQGDEPLLDPEDADRLVAAMISDPTCDIGTCAHPFAAAAEWEDPNCVKVVVDRRGMALYFSRAPVPGHFPGRPGQGHRIALRHVGIYAFRRRALDDFLALPPSLLEQEEGLEQLRALENGMSIKVVRIARAPVGVDTPADLERVRAILKDRNEPAG